MNEEKNTDMKKTNSDINNLKALAVYINFCSKYYKYTSLNAIDFMGLEKTISTLKPEETDLVKKAFGISPYLKRLVPLFPNPDNREIIVFNDSEYSCEDTSVNLINALQKLAEPKLKIYYDKNLSKLLEAKLTQDTVEKNLLAQLDLVKENLEFGCSKDKEFLNYFNSLKILYKAFENSPNLWTNSIKEKFQEIEEFLETDKVLEKYLEHKTA